jgi:hypothetical protein
MPGFSDLFQNNTGYQNLFIFLGIIFNAGIDEKTASAKNIGII